MTKISFREHAKRMLRAVGDVVGVQFANRDHFGVSFWHDFRRLDLRNDCFLDVGANIGQWATDARTNYPHASILSLSLSPKLSANSVSGFRMIGDTMRSKWLRPIEPGLLFFVLAGARRIRSSRDGPHSWRPKTVPLQFEPPR